LIHLRFRAWRGLRRPYRSIGAGGLNDQVWGSLNQDEGKAAFRRQEETATFRIEANIIALKELRSEDILFGKTRHHVGGVGESDPI